MFSVNFKKLVILILPIALRKVKTIKYLYAIIQPIITIYTIFTANREKNLYDLSITPQVCSLEKALNDRFDNTNRQIYIEDSIRPSAFYIFRNIENKPQYLNGTKYIYANKDYLATKTDFTVRLVSELQFDINEMTALLINTNWLQKIYN